MFGIVIDPATRLDAEAMGKRLANRGFETRPFSLGLHQQPACDGDGWAGLHTKNSPMAERLAGQGLYLLSGLGLRPHQIEEVIDAVREALL
jgi:perosamine synthetase